LAPIKKKDERIYPLNHIQQNKITVWSSVPSVISCMQRFRPSEQLANDLNIMFLCGEPFSLDVLKYVYKNLNVEHVYNFYGLTETGVENFCHPCSRQDLEKFESKGFVPIGLPLKGNAVKITEEKELLLSGCQITPGYLGGIGKERFEETEGVRWYHTGDIVEYDQGVYFCKGRLDSQVKIGGHRIELMDIESNIRKFKDVKSTVCFVDEAGSAGRLVCAVECAVDLDLSILSSWLEDKIPDYMVPRKIFIVDQMPVNHNGKIDRKAIKEIYVDQNHLQGV